MTRTEQAVDASPLARPEVAGAQRVVLKVGTRVLSGDDGRLALSRLFGLVETAARLRRAGREVLLVSSGAVGLGRDALGLTAPPDELAVRQACAAVGQCRLMALYDAGFARLGLIAAQVLLTQGDFDDRSRYLALRDTLCELLRRGVVPVINENDSVATEELAFVGAPGERPVFGDNDRLAALVAAKLGAELLVLITDVAGLLDRSPEEAGPRRRPPRGAAAEPRAAAPDSFLPSSTAPTDSPATTTPAASKQEAIREAGSVGADPPARVIERVDDLAAVRRALGESTSGAGRGGMRSKAESAWMAARAGCQALIVSGRDPGALDRALAGESEGTWFPAHSGLPARQRWLAFATAPRGALHLDPGAVAALVERGASLLARGVRRIDGAFEAGEVVALLDPEGRELGRGMVYCDAEAARAWTAGQAPEGARNRHALVHRDHLVLTP